LLCRSFPLSFVISLRLSALSLQSLHRCAPLLVPAPVRAAADMVVDGSGMGWRQGAHLLSHIRTRREAACRMRGFLLALFSCLFLAPSEA
jgi:hypothetical protein